VKASLQWTTGDALIMHLHSSSPLSLELDSFFGLCENPFQKPTFVKYCNASSKWFEMLELGNEFHCAKALQMCNWPAYICGAPTETGTLF
jgi:hypothetical protein